MAWGFSPKHVQDYSYENLNREHFLVVAIESAHKLGWDVSFVSETGFIAYTKFSWSSWSEEVTIKMEEENATIKSECTGSQMVDWGKNKKNVEALVATIEEVKSVLTEEEIETKLTELKQSFVSKEEDVLSKPPSTTKEKITDFFSIFKPVEGYFVSPILININLLIFVAMVASGVHFLAPENQSLLDWGANFSPLTLDGQWWRLLTACFIHIGILHLLLNMYALLYIGLLLEPYLGKTRFIAAYLISGIAASMASLWWNDLIISAGASGAIFGLYGVFLALLTTNLLDTSVKKSLLTSIGFFVFYNLINGLKPNSGIDNAAHIGGLLSGLVIGYAFVPSLRQHQNSALKFTTVGIMSAVLLISVLSVYSNLPNDIGEYDKKIKEFVSTEAMAMEVYELPANTSKAKLLYGLKSKGIYYWEKNLKLIESCESMNLPLDIRSRNRILKEYCELRIKSYELTYKGISEDTNQYKDEISNYNKLIDAKIGELNALEKTE